MELEVGFGNGVQSFTVPERNLQGVLTPNPVPHALTGEREVRRALSSPIGAPLLREVIHPGEKIAIITSDITRPMPTYTVMPALLDELYAGGARPEDITLVFALGSHRAQTPEEMRHLAGEQAWAQIRCVDSDPADVVHLGVTSRRTGAFAWATSNITTLPDIPAAPRPLCPASPLPARSSPITP